MLRRVLSRLLRRKKVLIACLAGLVVLLIWGGLTIKKADDGVPVTVADVEEKLLGESVFASGTVALRDEQTIYAAASKEVMEVKVKQGDQVKKGQILGYLDPSEENNRLREAEAGLAVEQANLKKTVGTMSQDAAAGRSNLQQATLALENKKAHLQRVQKLYEAGVESAEELEKAREEAALAETDYSKAQAELQKLQGSAASAERESLQAGVERAQAQLATARNEVEKQTLRAARDGIVIGVYIETGDYVNAGDKLMVIGDPEGLELESTLSEADANKVEVMQKAEVTCASIPQEIFSGSVAEVALTAEEETDGDVTKVEVPVKIAIENTKGHLRPGYTVDLRIITVPERKTLVLPYEAVVDTGKNSRVFVVEGDKAVPKNIKTGLESDLYVEVVQGLSKGEKVILNPDAQLRSGTKVQELPSSAAE